MSDSGHTWGHKEDFAKAAKDLEASRLKVKELERENEELREDLLEAAQTALCFAPTGTSHATDMTDLIKKHQLWKLGEDKERKG